ncbi:hypothetical protein J4444_02035 [Candidatus Woesearchaeota archaeon]|nr:hypothetical protein [Candidatus Woesearchaeota archaeon]
MELKRNLAATAITLMIIALLILAGPAKAIDVSLTTQNIDVSTDAEKDFTADITINSGEFLPILYTNITFDDGTNQITCKIDKEDNVSGCDFLSVKSRSTDNLYLGQDYGYGYGYNSNNSLGYHDFGYGYGYGNGDKGILDQSDSGTITYILTINSSKMPGSFMGNTIDISAKVYGGTDENYNYFKGTSNFQVNSTPVNTAIDPSIQTNISYNGIELEIPAGSLPGDATTLTMHQVKASGNPSSSTLKILGKTYSFDIDSATKAFSGPIRITFTYTDDELNLAGITDENDILPSFYTDPDWEQLTVISRDLENNKITFETTHFTEFTLLADTSTSTSGTSSTGGGDSTLFSSVSNAAEEISEKIVPEFKYPSCKTNNDCNQGEECKYIFDEYYRKCVKADIKETANVDISNNAEPIQGIGAPSNSITGFAIVPEAIKKNPIAAFIVGIIALTSVTGAYLFLRKRE